MAKGEYEFPILVTCLLILALQIHNPFQVASQKALCQCSGDAAATTMGAGLGAQRGVSPPAAQQYQPDPPPSRRPRAAGASPSGGGPSTDELLRELDSIQVKAKEQHETLSAAGKMPPPSPILQHLKETEAQEASQSSSQARAPRGGYAAEAPRGGYAAESSSNTAPTPYGGGAGPASAYAGGAAAQRPASADDGGAPLLRRREDFGRFLDARQPGGLGVVLGVGRGDFALRLLSSWSQGGGVFLVDPFIHVWRGYDDPANLNDRDHQLVFEDLRNRLAPMEGRYVLMRDFSHSFAEMYYAGGQTPGPPSFVYIDANHAEKAVSRDLELWWNLLSSGGILAGSTYADDSSRAVGVRSAVDRFAAARGLNVFLTHDDSPPSWFMFKEDSASGGSGRDARGALQY